MEGSNSTWLLRSLSFPLHIAVLSTAFGIVSSSSSRPSIPNARDTPYSASPNSLQHTASLYQELSVLTVVGAVCAVMLLTIFVLLICVERKKTEERRGRGVVHSPVMVDSGPSAQVVNSRETLSPAEDKDAIPHRTIHIVPV